MHLRHVLKKCLNLPQHCLCLPPSFASIQQNRLHVGAEDAKFGSRADFFGGTNVLEHDKGCSCFADPGCDNSARAPLSATFPFLSVMMAFLISAFVGFLQLMMGNSISAGGMSGSNSWAGWFSSSLKCSVHRFSCSSTVVSGFLSLSFTGMSVCWNLPASFLVVRYRSLKLT